MDKIMEIVRKHRLIVAVLGIGLLVSLSYAFYFRVRVAVDAKAYDSIAWSLVQGTGYTETTNPIPDASIGRLGPAYEFFLSFWYFLFGHRLWIIWIVQSLMHAGSALLVFLIIKQLLDDSRSELFAAIGAGFYIFFIDLLEFPAMLMTETLYLFLVLLGIYFSVQLWKKPTLRLTATVALFFTLAILVRPPAAVLMFFTVGFLLWNRLYRHIGMVILVAVVLMTPWTVRNYVRYHRFIPTSAILGYDVWVGNSPGSKYIGELTATKEIDTYADEKGLFAANERGLKEIKNLVLHHPITFLKIQLTKTSIYFSAVRPAAFWFHLTGTAQFITIIFSSLFAYVLFIFGVAGFWNVIKKNTQVYRMFILFTLAAPAGIVWIVAETRYRYQFYPMMIILGILFLAELTKNKKELMRILSISVVLVTANTLFDLLHNSARVAERLHNFF